MKKTLGFAVLVAVCGAALLWYGLQPGGTAGGTNEAVRPRASAQPAAPSAPTTLAVDGVRTTPPSKDSAPERTAQRVAQDRRSATAAPEHERRSQQRVSGAVVAATGTIADASIQLITKGKLVQSGRSDKRGQFTLAVARATGKCVVRVMARGFAPFEREIAALRAGESRLLGNLLIQPAQALRGRVVDPAARGVSGAEVSLRSRSVGSAQNQHRQRVITKTDGSFELSEAPLGAVQLHARARGLGEVILELQHQRDAPPLEIALLSERRLLLRLVDLDQRPVVGAELSIHTATTHPAQHEGVTDSKGMCAFDGLSAAEWEVRIVDPKIRPAAKSGVLADGRPHRIEVTRWPCVRGRVAGPGRSSLPPGGQARLVPANIRGDSVRLAGAQAYPLGSDGAFEICGVRPGQFLIRAEVPGFAPTHSQVLRVQLSEDADYGPIVLQRGGALHVAIERDGQPLPGAQVDVFISAPQEALIWIQDSGILANLVRSERTDGTGHLLLEHLSAGDVWFIVRSDECVPHLAGPFQVLSDRELSLAPIELEAGGFLAGAVLDSEGHGILGAFVMLIGNTGRPANIQLTTDATGAYRSPPLPHGIWEVRARALGGRNRSPSERVEANVRAGEVTSLDLVL